MLVLLLAFAFWIAINGRLNLYGYLASFSHAALVKSVQPATATPAASPAQPTGQAGIVTPTSGFNDPGMSQFSEAAGGTAGATATNVNPTAPGWMQYLQGLGLYPGATQ